MGFYDEYGNRLINEEQKIRIRLSAKARFTIEEDMYVFGVPKVTTFINTVFGNYKLEAKASLSLYLKQKQLELEELFHGRLDASAQKAAIDVLLSQEEEKIREFTAFDDEEADSRPYHINDENTEYLLEECEEEKYYKSPARYIRAVIEEYCSLPFIERERIYRKEVYDIVERACRESQTLKIKTVTKDHGRPKPLLLYVSPYKIVPDPLHTQDYLVCYSRIDGEGEDKKIAASFSMARLAVPTLLKKKAFLSRAEKRAIDASLAKDSPAYLTALSQHAAAPDEEKIIRVRLTEEGKASYRSRLYSRPEKTKRSSDDIYEFDCPHQQIYDYFFAFGDKAEILAPPRLRQRFIEACRKTLDLYNQS